MVQIWGGQLGSDAIKPGGATARQLAERLRNRELLYRAYAFSSRFLANVDGFPEKEREETHSLVWSGVMGAVEDYEQSRVLASQIFDKAKEISEALTELQPQAEHLSVADIVVDLAKHNHLVKSTDILVALPSGRISTPNFFFKADKWTAAYTQQKQCGHVFAPRDSLQLVRRRPSILEAVPISRSRSSSRRGSDSAGD